MPKSSDEGQKPIRKSATAKPVSSTGKTSVKSATNKTASVKEKALLKEQAEETLKPAKKSAKPKADAENAPVKKAGIKKETVKKTPSKKITVKTASGEPANIGPQHEPLSNVEAYSLFTDFDIALFKSGKHYKLYEKFGSHVLEHKGVIGTYFSVWAPNAQYVSVIGNFNGWNPGSNKLHVRWDSSGIWEGFIPNIGNGETYKYHISSYSGEELQKSDPFALQWELPPRTATVVGDTWYEWTDGEWMKNRWEKNALNKPVSVYEVHLGSWARSPEDPGTFLSYNDMAKKLVPYVKEMGFTHVEFMPLAEHPYYPSWGYQITGYFAATARYGSPKELMHLIECFHKEGIGVIMDWVPSHFPGDQHGLFRFDGSHLYEHEDMRRGYQPDWKSYIFNYGRNEVRSFLISNAFFWLERYHIDGLRVDAVASMLYLDYSRNYGEWEQNIYGGNENLEVISLLKELNEAVYSNFPDVQTIAEESTSFYGVSRPVYNGGLGFGMKWMMGWMNDALSYFKQDPINRKYHHNQITFSLVYAFTENFMLPLSHDEVVHGKKSLLYKMPGDDWQRFANLRALYSLMFTHPGTKLLFMGAEFGQSAEWNVQQSLDWHLLENESHQGISELIKALNSLYKNEPALYERSFDADGFEWIESADGENSIISYLRKGNDPKDDLVVIINLTPVVRPEYKVGLPANAQWKEIFNSDNRKYWGSGILNPHLKTDDSGWNFREHSLKLTLPALSAIVLKKV